MAKRLFLIIIAGLIGIINGPTFLSATDNVAVTGLDPAKLVDTVLLPEPEPAFDLASVEADSYAAYDTYSPYVAEVATEEVAYEEYVEPVAVMPANAISVAGHVLPIVDVADTSVDAGDHVNKYGAKLLYGHNTAEVFGDLIYVGVGSVFTVAYGGVSRNYQVVDRVIYEKQSSTTLAVDGQTYKMKAVANGRGRYDMVLMTCYGTSYGNGDASHRLVLYANEI